MSWKQRHSSTTLGPVDETELAVADLTDRVEFWKNACAQQASEVEELRSERARLEHELRVAQAWVVGLASQVEEAEAALECYERLSLGAGRGSS